MGLKSYRLREKLKKKGKKMKKRVGDTGRIVQSGVTALIGTAFVTQVASAINRL